MYISISVFRLMHAHAVGSEEFWSNSSKNNYYFEELQVNTCIFLLNVYYYESLKLFSAEFSVVKQLVKRTIGNINSKYSTLHT